MRRQQRFNCNSNEIGKMRGGTKEPAKEEQVTIDFAFATVCTD
jgi:N-acetylneuraminate synthase